MLYLPRLPEPTEPPPDTRDLIAPAQLLRRQAYRLTHELYERRRLLAQTVVQHAYSGGASAAGGSGISPSSPE
jgi:hypothetical protein